MAYDLFRGRTRANHAISGRPPINSYEWDFVRGVPRNPQRPARPRSAASGMGAKVSVWPPQFKLYEISPTDFDAAKKWMANIAENVKYHRKVHGDRILTAEDEELWGALWRKWLLFGNRITQLAADRGLMDHIISNTMPGLRLSRLFAVEVLGIGMMSEENKREFDAYLHQAKALEDRFHLLGMGQVPVPYMGELVVMIRQMPKEMTLSDMAARLRATAKVGNRLLDQNTAWWQWKRRTETAGLRRATADCELFAKELEKNAKLPEGQGTRDRETPVWKKFMRTVSLVYIEAAGLYGIEETKSTARAQLHEDMQNMPKDAGKMALWILFVAGVGYLGIRWLTSTKVVVIEKVASPNPVRPPGYHPGDLGHEAADSHQNVDMGEDGEENISQEHGYQDSNPDMAEEEDTR
jgi:hypothetical protein